MKKILIVNTAGLGVGGITSHMINYIHELRRQKYDVALYVVVTGIRNEKVINKFENLECKLYYLPDRKKHLIQYICMLERLIKEENFNIIHVHGNSATMLIELDIAKMNGIEKRVAHCHNTECTHRIAHTILLPIFRFSYTDAVACSDSAGDWIFGKNNFTVLPNSIDIKKYTYDAKKRYQIRKKYNIEKNTFVIGHIGAFNKQKNQKFLVDIFNELKRYQKSILLLIGDGEKKESIINYVNELSLQDNVLFIDTCNDVEKYLQAMDVFVFPSKWEGFGMVLLEAQAAGLPIIASNVVPDSVKLSKDFIKLSLNEDISLWCNNIISFVNNKKNRYDLDEKIYKYSMERGFDSLKKIYKLNDEEIR